MAAMDGKIIFEDDCHEVVIFLRVLVRDVAQIFFDFFFSSHAKEPIAFDFSNMIHFVSETGRKLLDSANSRLLGGAVAV